MKKKWELFLHYLIEFLIVFSGVYIAFMLTEMKENRIESQRRTQIYKALKRELIDVSANSKQFAAEIDRILLQYKTAIENGQFPQLHPFIQPIHFTPHMWNATIQSDGLNLLEIDQIEKISQFYNEVQQLLLKVEKLGTLSHLYLIPNMDKPKEEFYNIELNNVKSKYEWYFGILQGIVKDCDKVCKSADTLILTIDDF